MERAGQFFHEPLSFYEAINCKGRAQTFESPTRKWEKSHRTSENSWRREQCGATSSCVVHSWIHWVIHSVNTYLTGNTIRQCTCCPRSSYHFLAIWLVSQGWDPGLPIEPCAWHTVESTGYSLSIREWIKMYEQTNLQIFHWAYDLCVGTHSRVRYRDICLVFLQRSVYFHQSFHIFIKWYFCFYSFKNK